MRFIKNLLPFSLKFHEDTVCRTCILRASNGEVFLYQLADFIYIYIYIYVFKFIYLNNCLICLFTGRNVEVYNIVRYEVLTAILSKI